MVRPNIQGKYLRKRYAICLQRIPKSARAFIYFNIGIKHGFSCINNRQVPREVLKTEAAVFNTSLGTWRMLMYWKTMFDCYYCIKTENICYISRNFFNYFVSPFHRCLANAISTNYARSRARQYTSRTAANLWPRYDHIESCVAVH